VIETLMERAEFFQGLGGWELAVADWKLIERLFNKGYPGPSMLDTASMLNGLAYARALADVELEQALKNANEAVRREPRSPMFLDTRGYIFYRLGELGKASDDLDVAVDRFRQIWESEIRRDNEERRNRLITRDLKERRQQLDRAMATLLYHRLLVHDALLDEQAAAADEAEIRALGFDPNDPDELF
jgi:tetratricopeptide (TPR) repeat protein